MDETRGYFFAGSCLKLTADGGKTWANASLPGGWPDEMEDVILGQNLEHATGTGSVCTPLVRGIAPVNNAWCDQEGKRYRTAAVFSTVDGGKSWRSAYLAAGPVFRGRKIIAVSDLKFFILAQNAIFRSEDGGITWAKAELRSSTCIPAGFPGEFENLPVALGFYTTRLGWISYLDGTLLHTTDGGQRWCSLGKPTVSWPTDDDREHYLAQMHFLSDTVGWARSADGSLLRTQDGGLTWRRMTLPTITDISVTGDGVVWAVGASGVFTNGPSE